MSLYHLERIINYVTGKKVLDVGCLGNSWSNQLENPDRPYYLLRQNAKEVVGIDIQKKKVEKYRKQGYNIKYGDAERFNLGEKFDIIFASEIIEHLSNPGLFLECARKHLKPGGHIIITTPNALSLTASLRSFWFVIGRNMINSEHTCWYGPVTISELLRRYGFKPIMLESYFPGYYPRFINALFPKKARSQLILVAKTNKKKK